MSTDLKQSPIYESDVVKPVPDVITTGYQPPSETPTPVQAAAESEAKATERAAQAEAARARATQYMTERKFVEARKSLEEAEAFEAEPMKDRAARVMTNLRSRLPKRSGNSHTEAGTVTTPPETNPVEKSMATVNLYSKIAAVAGILPGGLLNFAAILAVQVTMVWRISRIFGHTEGKERVRGSVMSLIGSALPTGLGHGAGIAIAAIPAVIAGTVVYFVVTPVLAYAMTRAVGNVFIMHFESGGTLLTFDPKAFADYFLKEFQKAGGSLKSDAPDHIVIATA